MKHLENYFEKRDQKRGNAPLFFAYFLSSIKQNAQHSAKWLSRAP
jgi:hypothetical protein